MKRLKSSLQDLKDILEKSFKVSSVTERFVAFNGNDSAVETLKFINKNNFDVIGVSQDGQVTGYANKSDLRNGKLGDYKLLFKPADLLVEETPLAQVFEALNVLPRIFVQVGGKVDGIVTRGDMQKIPVRMWLFGLVSLIEMQLLRTIREYYPDESWKTLLKDDKRQKAELEFAKRKSRNEETDLADCLQFGDKRIIVFNNNKILSQTQIDSKKAAKALKELEILRNNLAHSQELIAQDWPKTVELVANGVSILQKLENVQRLID